MVYDVLFSLSSLRYHPLFIFLELVCSDQLELKFSSTAAWVPRMNFPCRWNISVPQDGGGRIEKDCVLSSLKSGKGNHRTLNT